MSSGVVAPALQAKRALPPECSLHVELALRFGVPVIEVGRKRRDLTGEVALGAPADAAAGVRGATQALTSSDEAVTPA